MLSSVCGQQAWVSFNVMIEKHHIHWQMAVKVPQQMIQGHRRLNLRTLGHIDDCHVACLPRVTRKRRCRPQELTLELCVQDLSDKIAQLNAAIDDVSAQLKAQDQVMSSVDDGSAA